MKIYKTTMQIVFSFGFMLKKAKNFDEMTYLGI